MKLTPLASESMGVRSMAFLVETSDVSILIDPSVALCPIRNGLKPHKIEKTAERTLRSEIIKAARETDVITISHYHYDHHDPDLKSLYRKKKVLLKHPTENINKSQRSRAKVLLKTIEPRASAIEYADGTVFEFGNTCLEFSAAVPHGTNTRLGYVVQLAVAEGDQTFLHTSDVQGPSLGEQFAFILEKDPDTIACDGPMTYMLYRYGNKALASSIENLQHIITETRVRNLMLDHHLLRELKWREKVAPVLATAEEAGCKVQTFAEFAGKENELLEARRKDLWGKKRKRK